MSSLADMYTHVTITRAHAVHIKTAKAEQLVQEIDKILPLIEPLVEKRLMQEHTFAPTEEEALQAMMQLIQLSHDEKIQHQLQRGGNGSMLGTLSASLMGVMPELREALHDDSVVGALRDVTQEAADLPDTILKHL